MAYPRQVSIGVWPHLNSSNFVLRLDDRRLGSTELEYKTSDRCHPNDFIMDDFLSVIRLVLRFTILALILSLFFHNLGCATHD